MLPLSLDYHHYNDKLPQPFDYWYYNEWYVMIFELVTCLYPDDKEYQSAPVSNETLLQYQAVSIILTM